MLTDVIGVVNPMVIPPLGISDHYSILFFIKMGFKIPNITLSRKVYLNSHIDWPCICEDLRNSNWIVLYSIPNLLSELNKMINCLIDMRVSSKVIRRKVTDKAWFNKDCVNEFHYKQNTYCL